MRSTCSGSSRPSCFDAARRRLETQRIPDFERPERVRVAPAHGAVDLHDAVRNLRHHLGGVEDVIAQQLPEKTPGFVIERHEGFQPLGERLDFAHGFERSKAGLVRRMVFERLPVDRVDFAVFADALIKALSASCRRASRVESFR